jgi:hypothetical protein
MAQYTHHPQHYLSTQQSHRLLAYKPPPPQPSQSQSFIPTTTSTNIVSKRQRSPSSSHIYSSPSNKSSRSTLVSQMHTSKLYIFFCNFKNNFFKFNLGPPSPGSTYSSSSSQQVARNGAPTYPSPQNQSAFSAYLSYLPPSSSTATGPSVPYASQMPRVRGPSQISSMINFTLNVLSYLFCIDYINPLSFLPQPIVDPKQQAANAYSHHPMLIPSKNGSIMNGYPLKPQQ